MNKIGNERKETEGKKTKKGTIDKKRWETKGRREGREVKKSVEKYVLFSSQE